MYLRDMNTSETPLQLEDDLEWCRTLQTRKFSPRFLRYLSSWEQKLLYTMEGHYTVHRAETLRAYRGCVESHLEKVQELDGHHEILEELMRLRRNKFLLDYGDYLTFDLQRLRTDKPFQGAVWNKRFNSWDQVLQDIQAADIQEANDRSKQPPLLAELREAANELDCPYELLLFQIRTYVSRNRVAHSDIHLLVTTQQWTKLSQKMVRDRKELESIFPWSSEEEMSSFKVVIDRAAKRYFKELDPEGASYDLSDYARNIQKELREKPHRKSS